MRGVINHNPGVGCDVDRCFEAAGFTTHATLFSCGRALPQPVRNLGGALRQCNGLEFRPHGTRGGIAACGDEIGRTGR